MNAIEPAIPTEVEGGAPIDLKPADLGPLPIVLTVLGLWWVLVLLALACLIGSGLCDRHRGMRKFRAAGIALTIAAGLIVVPTVVSMFLTVSVGDAGPNEQAIVDAVAGTVRNGYLLVAGIALVIGVAVILLSVFLKPKSGHEQPEVAV
jgi:membrane protease YdiL (CAAX protease family)